MMFGDNNVQYCNIPVIIEFNQIYQYMCHYMK